MNQIGERGRALIMAAAVLDRPNVDPDDDLTILARQLTRAQEALDITKRALVTVGYLSVTNLGSERESGRPPHYLCRLCGDWNDEMKHVEHADGCPLK